MAECCTADDERKLTEIFDDALDIYEKITKSDEASSSSKLQIEIKQCISLLEKATHLINAGGLFSSNESVEEVPSQNLRYFLIPALLGGLVVKVQTQDRLGALETAEVYFKDFLKRIQDYGIIGALNLEELEEEEQECQPKKLDLRQMAIQRNEKIRKYREQKETENELKRLKSLLLGDDDDDEICRNYYITYIKNLVNSSVEELKLIKQEKPLAKHLAESKTKSSCLPSKEDEDEEERRCKLKPFKPIIITRNEFQKQVFGAGYPSLPTMTVDEFYKQRVAEGIFPAHGSSHGKVLQEMTDPEVVKREEEKEAVEKENEIETDDPKYLDKARKMDDYKDDHRRGWGNRMNRS